MAFKDFKLLNEYVSETAEIVDKLESISSLCQNGVAQISTLKQISDAYARQYSLIQQIQYDADGNIQDVTSEARLSVPNSVIDNAKQQTERLSLAIRRIKDVNLGNVILNERITPIADVYTCSASGQDPQLLTSIENYYYKAGDGSMYLTDALIDNLSGDVGLNVSSSNAMFSFMALSLVIPCMSQDSHEVHQIKWIGASTQNGLVPKRIVLVHTGSFNKAVSIENIKGKNLLDEATYNLSLTDDIGLSMRVSGGMQSTWPKQYPVEWVRCPGQPVYQYLDMATGENSIKTVDFRYSISTESSADIWAILVRLADNSDSILQILNVV